MCAYPEFVAGVGMHPSHSPISGLVGDDERKLLEGAKSAQILFMPASDDHENVRAGGLAEQVRNSPASRCLCARTLASDYALNTGIG